jgi:hypothetical protein
LSIKIDSYFTKTPVYDLNKASQRFIKEKVTKVERLIKNKKILKKEFIYPLFTAAVISVLETSKTDRLECTFENNKERY